MNAEIGVIVGLALALAAVFVVTKPLRHATNAVVSDDIALADLLAKRDAAYQVLRDLDSDFHTGKLAEDDYRPMRVQALARAAEIVAQLDDYQTQNIPNPAQASRTSKSQVQSPKSPVANRKPALSGVEGSQTAYADYAFCPQCGTPHAPDDAFCRKCGRALTGVSGQPPHRPAQTGSVVGGHVPDD